MRLVTWTGVNPPTLASHVNVDSDLAVLIRSALQWFHAPSGAKYGFFLVNYDPEQIEIAPSSSLAKDEFWPTDITPPVELVDKDRNLREAT